MIDIHSHIIPGADDGSSSEEESLRMLKTAYESGVAVIAATPHYDPASGFPRCSFDELNERLLALRRAAERERIPIEIARGMEIFASEELPELLEEGRVWTLAHTRYFLVEFSFVAEAEYCTRILRRCRQKGFLPIVAHPERYKFIQERPQTAYEWCRSGYALQLNKGSILGRFGEHSRVTAMRLVSHGLAACAASDAHGAERRTTQMRGVKSILSEDFGEDHAGLLLERNPARILAGKGLQGFEPFPFI